MTDKGQRVSLEVRATARGAVLARVTRTVHQHAGWQSVHWAGREYQLFGGIRGAYFIDTSNKPLRDDTRFVGRMIA